MNRAKYFKAKNVAIAVAIAMVGATVSPVAIAGGPSISYAASTTKTEYQETGNINAVTFEDLRIVGDGGTFISYYTAVERGDKITPNTKFAVVDPKTHKTIPWVPAKDDWAMLLGYVDKDGKEDPTGGAPIYVKDDNGNMMLLYMWMMMGNNRSSYMSPVGGYYTAGSGGDFKAYTPSKVEESQIKRGTFNGKSAATPAVALSADSLKKLGNNAIIEKNSSLSKSKGTAKASSSTLSRGAKTTTVKPSTTTTVKPSTTTTTKSTTSTFGGTGRSTTSAG